MYPCNYWHYQCTLFMKRDSNSLCPLLGLKNRQNIISMLSVKYSFIKQLLPMFFHVLTILQFFFLISFKVFKGWSFSSNAGIYTIKTMLIKKVFSLNIATSRYIITYISKILFKTCKGILLLFAADLILE